MVDESSVPLRSLSADAPTPNPPALERFGRQFARSICRERFLVMTTMKLNQPYRSEVHGSSQSAHHESSCPPSSSRDLVMSPRALPVVEVGALTANVHQFIYSKGETGKSNVFSEFRISALSAQKGGQHRVDIARQGSMGRCYRGTY